MSDDTGQRAEEFDVVVVGAGVSGLYALHHFRELGFTVHVVEAGDGVGGTWYWNRYPGARCDVPSMEYSYGFSPELEQEWEWTEVFPAQEELERYFNHVADRFDLRRDIQLGTRVTAATYDDDRGALAGRHRSRTTTSRAQFLVMATGCLSAPLDPQIPGRDTFAGLSLFTNAWPDGGRPTSPASASGWSAPGRRACRPRRRSRDDADHLVRVPAHAVVRVAGGQQAARPRPAADGEGAVPRAARAAAEELRRRRRARAARSRCRCRGTSPSSTRPRRSALAAVDELGWAACRAWSDVLRDLEANELGAELYREMVRRVIDDPETADGLSPRELPIGCKRPILHTDYYETFNRDHVHARRPATRWASRRSRPPASAPRRATSSSTSSSSPPGSTP